MDPRLAELVANDTPKLNPAIMDGLAVSHMQHAEAYVDSVFKVAARGFPEGLLYLGCRQCTPKEEFDIVTKMKGTRRSYDIATSNMRLMQYFFEYKGEKLPPRYLYLPYVSDAGTIMISGSRFNISPILSDRVISIDMNNIFVRLLRDRLTFNRSSHHFMVSGRRETVQVAWSTIYHKQAKYKKLKPTVKANSTLMHYLLCKYGFTEAFKRFGNCSPVVGGVEVNTNTYPQDKWVICSSTQIKPKGFGRGVYEPSTLRVAIKIEEFTPVVKNMIGGFFYVVDHFPARIRQTADYLDSRRLWMILLGHIVFSGTLNEGKLHDDIADHISSLDEYLDSLVAMKLKEIGIEVDDIYQLFAVIIENFNDWLLGASDKVSSMYDKELSILYYVLYDITSAIFTLYFKLRAAGKKQLTSKEIVATMKVILKPGLVFAMTRLHGEVSSISSSGDNKAFKITSTIIPQSKSSKLNGRDRDALSDPGKRLNVSVAEVGAAFAMTKADPSGRSRINGCVTMTPECVITRNPKFVELLSEVQSKISR